MDPKTYTIISDKGGGFIYVKESCANRNVAAVFSKTINVAAVFWTNIKDSKGEILWPPVGQMKFFVAESGEEAYADCCDWMRREIDKECKFEERHNAFEDLIGKLRKCGASQKNG